MPRYKHSYKGINGLKAIAKSIGSTEMKLSYRLSTGMTMDEAVQAVKKDLAPGQASLRKPVDMSPLWAQALGMSL